MPVADTSASFGTAVIKEERKPDLISSDDGGSPPGLLGDAKPDPSPTPKAPVAKKGELFICYIKII